MEPTAYIRHYAFLHLIILTTLQTKSNSKKETQMYLLKIIQLINGQIRNQNQDHMTPKPSVFSTPPGYLHNSGLEIRPITYSVSLN